MRVAPGLGAALGTLGRLVRVLPTSLLIGLVGLAAAWAALTTTTISASVAVVPVAAVSVTAVDGGGPDGCHGPQCGGGGPDLTGPAGTWSGTGGTSSSSGWPGSGQWSSTGDWPDSGRWANVEQWPRQGGPGDGELGGPGGPADLTSGAGGPGGLIGWIMGLVTQVLSSFGLDTPTPGPGSDASTSPGGEDLAGGLGEALPGSLGGSLPAGLADLPADLGDVAPVDLPVDLGGVLPVELPAGVEEPVDEVPGPTEGPRENIEQPQPSPTLPALPGGSGDQAGEFDGSGDPAPAAPGVWARMTGLDPSDHRGLDVQSGGWRPQPVGFATSRTSDWALQAWRPGTLFGPDPRTALGGYLGEVTRAVMTAAHTTGTFPPARLPGPAGGSAVALAGGSGPGGPGGGPGGGWRGDTPATGHDQPGSTVGAEGADLDGSHAAAAHHERMSWLAAAHGFHDPHNATTSSTDPDGSNTNTGTVGGAGGQAWLTGAGMAVPTRDGGTLTLIPTTTSPHARTTPDLAQGRYLIHIDNAAAPGSYDFALDMPAGARAVENTSGGVDILGPGGQNLQTIAAPWARDAHGRDLPTRFQVSRGPDGATTLTQHVAFDETTAFPVLADPDTGATAGGADKTDAAQDVADTGGEEGGGTEGGGEGAEGTGGGEGDQPTGGDEGGEAASGAEGGGETEASGGAEDAGGADTDAAGAGEGAEGAGADPAGAGESTDTPGPATDTDPNNATAGPAVAPDGQPGAETPPPAGDQQDPHTVPGVVDGQPVTILLTGTGTSLEDPADGGPQGDQSGPGCTGPSCPPGPPGSPVDPTSGSPGCFGGICEPGAIPPIPSDGPPGCWGGVCEPGAAPPVDAGGPPGCWGGICEPGATPTVTDDPPTAPPSGGDEPETGPVVLQVSPGDNLSDLAESLGVDPADLIGFNQGPGGALDGRDPNLIHPGEDLQIPPTWDGTWTIRPGDTAGEVAERFQQVVPDLSPRLPGVAPPVLGDMPLERLLEQNRGPGGVFEGRNPDLIHPGEQLHITPPVDLRPLLGPGGPGTAPGPTPDYGAPLLTQAGIFVDLANNFPRGVGTYSDAEARHNNWTQVLDRRAQIAWLNGRPDLAQAYQQQAIQHVERAGWYGAQSESLKQLTAGYPPGLKKFLPATGVDNLNRDPRATLWERYGNATKPPQAIKSYGTAELARRGLTKVTGLFGAPMAVADGAYGVIAQDEPVPHAVGRAGSSLLVGTGGGAAAAAAVAAMVPGAGWAVAGGIVAGAYLGNVWSRSGAADRVGQGLDEATAAFANGDIAGGLGAGLRGLGGGAAAFVNQGGRDVNAVGRWIGGLFS